MTLEFFLDLLMDFVGKTVQTKCSQKQTPSLLAKRQTGLAAIGPKLSRPAQLNKCREQCFHIHPLVVRCSLTELWIQAI